MNRKTKDRLVDAGLIVLFLAIVSACAWLILKAMTRWTVEGLG
jgi:hypothetical protein